MKNSEIHKLLKVIKKLRDPKNGCPWDKKQTMDSIMPHTIEEVYEVAEQVYRKNFNKLKEELGDLLFQVVFISQIAAEKKKFNFNDVVKSITKKMIHRHPHVFKKKKFKNLKEFKFWWENSKKKNNNFILENIPVTLPALQEANKIQKKVALAGFEYKSDQEAIHKVYEELDELKIEIKNNNKIKIKEELGDLIFSVLDVSRKLKLDPESILKKSNKKFKARWKKLEKYAIKENINLIDLNINQYNNIWDRIKKI